MDSVRTLARFAALFVVFAVAGCRHNPVSPSAPSGRIVVETLVATVGIGGTAFYSFTASTAGDVRLTLLSVKQNGADLPVSLNLGVGTPAGTGCTVTSSLLAAAGASPQLTTSVSAGVHCASVTDPNLLTAPAAVVLNIAHP